MSMNYCASRTYLFVLFGREITAAKLAGRYKNAFEDAAIVPGEWEKSF